MQVKRSLLYDRELTLKFDNFLYSYNAVNGVPSCANDFLQNEIVRRQWGFEGYIVNRILYLVHIQSKVRDLFR